LQKVSDPCGSGFGSGSTTLPLVKKKKKKKNSYRFIDGVANFCRVIVMPHSHNDPGWLKTVEGYFATATKHILDNIVNKLTQHTNMTFIWSEVGHLSQFKAHT
jgi:hypothetical protein